jgi:hypothetical protein
MRGRPAEAGHYQRRSLTPARERLVISKERNMTRNGILHPLALAGVLAVGFGAVWGMVGEWVAEIVMYAAGGERQLERLSFLNDGTAWVEVEELGERRDRHYRDLDGNPVPAPRTEKVGWLRDRMLRAQPAVPASIGAPAWDDRVRSFVDGRSPATFWYLISDGQPGGTSYFVGYDSRSNVRVGYLGTAGFRETVPPADELFPCGGPVSGPRSCVLNSQDNFAPTAHPRPDTAGQAPHGSLSTWDVYVLGHDGKLYHADLHARKVHVVLDGPAIRWATVVLGHHDPATGTPHHVAVRTDDAVLVLDECGGLLSRYPIPEPLRAKDLAFGETWAGEAIMHWHSGSDAQLDEEIDHRVFWVTPDGRFREAAVTLPGFNARLGQAVAPLAVPSPLLLAALLVYERAPSLLEEGRAATYGEAVVGVIAEYWPSLVAAEVLAAGFALLCHRRQVRYGASGAGRLAWPLFVLVFGLPGWVAFRFGQAWPVLEPCPACGAAAPRDREGCASCAADFPRPALKGTEVYA